MINDCFIQLGKKFIAVDKDGVFSTSLTKVGQVDSFFNIIKPLHDENGKSLDLIKLKRITKDYLKTIDK